MPFFSEWRQQVRILYSLQTVMPSFPDSFIVYHEEADVIYHIGFFIWSCPEL
jgi:hypothetical protein